MSLDKTVLVFRFVSCLISALVSASAMAALPFDVRAPDFPTPTEIVDAVSNSCADYNNRVSTIGVSLAGGANQPGACGFSTFHILMDGQPAAQYLALVASGANPPPFRTVFRPPSAKGYCAVATAVRVELGASVQPNVSSWPKAGAIGGACGAESGRHPFIDYGALDARGTGRLRSIGHFLDVAVSGPNTTQVCVEKQLPHSEMIVTQKLAAAFAAKVQSALNSHPILSLEAQWNQGAGITTNCLLRCNQCGSGWAGTITNTQVIQDSPSPPHPHQFLANEVDTYFVGGAPLVVGNTTSYPADWTTAGGGFNKLGNKTWILNAAATGACPPVPTDQHVCVKVITDTMGARSFTQTNDPLRIVNGYTFNMNGTVFPSDAGENQFWNVIPLSAAATDTLASGHLVLSAASSCTHPPQASAVTPLICKQTWDWQLFLQQ
jgi:hypothetical protein